MKKSALIFILSILTVCNVHAQTKDERAIRAAMNEQLAAWNQGNIDRFMDTYWPNDSLMFMGKSGVTYGWEKTKANYIKGYPDTAAMGKLDFTIIKVKRLSAQYYFVVGKWHLTRSIGDVGGMFNLLFQKINDKWLIIADHSS